MKLNTFKGDLFWALAVIFALAMSLLVGTAFTLVRQFDLAAKQREEAVVLNGFAGRIDEVARMVVPQVVWDDAVRHLDNDFDAGWAKDNIAQFLAQTDGFDAEFILGADDKVVFSAHQTEIVSHTFYDRFRREAQPLIASVRAVERRRGPVKIGRKGVMVSAPVQDSSVALIGDDLYILTATLVQPDFGAALPSGRRAPIVVAGMIVDPQFLKGFAKRYMLQGLRLRHGDSELAAQEAHAPLVGRHGDQVATLDWIPQSPGRTLLHNIVAPILSVVALLSMLALALYRRGRRMAQGLVASEARAAHLAYFDALTGLPNRVTFFDRLSAALDQARRSGATVAVHCIDLDRFKEVNDTFGHHAGDELIRIAGQRMAAQCRSSDVFARLSGDEFAIVQTDATPAAAAALAARLIEALSAPVDLSAGRVFVGCSVGVSMVADAVMEPAEALRQADLALYRAKQLGGVQYAFFELEMDAAIKMRRTLEADLREALARGDLQMAYQPQVDRRGVVSGVEALVRWKHPSRGQLSPAFFVPIAEECGLIHELGMFTMRRAFEDSRRWSKLRVAVNVSANQIRMRDFVDNVAALVDEMDVDPRRFELEITEGLLLGDDPGTHDTLSRLRQMGFSLALDDFGTGYSSLSYLQRFPVTKIKIDRSFIANLGVDQEAAALVGAIVKLARTLKLGVIAEGVETQAQLDTLVSAGCSDIQGYVFSRPVPAEAIDAVCNRRLPVA